MQKAGLPFEKIIPKFLRGQCELINVSNKKLVTWEDEDAHIMFVLRKSLSSESEPSSATENSISLSTSEKNTAQKRTIIKTTENSKMIEGIMAPQVISKENQQGEIVLFQTGGGDRRGILTADISQTVSLIIRELEKPTLPEESKLQKALKLEQEVEASQLQLSTEFVQNWTSFTTQMETLEKSTGAFKLITAQLKIKTDNNPAEIKDDLIWEVIEENSKKIAKTLKQDDLTLEQKIGLQLHYQTGQASSSEERWKACNLSLSQASASHASH